MTKRTSNLLLLAGVAVLLAVGIAVFTLGKQRDRERLRESEREDAAMQRKVDEARAKQETTLQDSLRDMRRTGRKLELERIVLERVPTQEEYNELRLLKEWDGWRAAKREGRSVSDNFENEKWLREIEATRQTATRPN